MKQRPEKITSRYSDEYRFELQKVEPTYKDKPGRAVNENKSYARVSKPRFIKDKNNPNFLNVYIDYDLGPGGSSIALGKETMTGQIRRESAAEAMRLAGDIARDLEAEYDLEDIDIQDLENGKVRIFAVSDDFMDMQEKDFNIGESVNEAKTYKKGDKLKIKLKNGKKFDVVFDSYSRTKGVALGKFKDRSGEYDTKPFNLDTIVESVNEDKKLTYSDFVDMVRADMKAGAASDENASKNQIERVARWKYDDYLKGTSVDDLFEATKGAMNYFSDLKFNYQKAFRYLDVEEREEYKRLVKDFFSKLQVDDKVRAVGLEEAKVEYKVAGRPVELNKGEKSDGTDWTVTFKNGKTTSLSNVLALIEPEPELTMNEAKATCCHRCGRVHVKGTPCKRPYLKGKDSCAVKEVQDLQEMYKKLEETKSAPEGHYFTKSGNLVKGRMTKDAEERGARKSDPKDKIRSKIPKVTQYAEAVKEYMKKHPKMKKSKMMETIRSIISEHETDPALELMVGDYQTKHYHMCPGAKALYQDIESKGVDMDLAVRTAKLQDALFAMEEEALDNGATEVDLFAAETVASQIMDMARMMGLEEEHSYIQGHITKIKNALIK